MSLIPTKELTQQREHQVWLLRVRCYSQAQIAQELGITQGAVSQILKRVRARLAKEFAQGAINMRLEQTEQLMDIAREALAAWEASKQQVPPAPREEVRESPAPLPLPQPTAEPTPLPQPEEPAEPAEAPPPPRQPGKPAYLRAALQSLAAIRALWNMDKIAPAEAGNPADHYKIILGIDYDHLFTQEGVHIPREKIAHRIPEGE